VPPLDSSPGSTCRPRWTCPACRSCLRRQCCFGFSPPSAAPQPRTDVTGAEARSGRHRKFFFEPVKECRATAPSDSFLPCRTRDSRRWSRSAARAPPCPPARQRPGRLSGRPHQPSSLVGRKIQLVLSRDRAFLRGGVAFLSEADNHWQLSLGLWTTLAPNEPSRLGIPCLSASSSTSHL